MRTDLSRLVGLVNINHQNVVETFSTGPTFPLCTKIQYTDQEQSPKRGMWRNEAAPFKEYS